MKRRVQAGAAKLLSMVLAAVLALAPVPAAAEEGATAENAGKNQSNTRLGVSGLSDPDVPSDKDAPWSGSYVYFGTYDGNPIKFRVLAKDSTAYTAGKALFLDSDAALFEDSFDKAEPYSNSWNGSSLQATLNGPFLDGFSAPEQAAIADSTGNGGISYRADPSELSLWGVPISVNDKVFLLDSAAATNEAYGYSSDEGRTEEDGRWHSHTVYNRKKAAHTGAWFLRTAISENSENRGWHVLAVNFDGTLFTESAANAGVYLGGGVIGVAPALNIDQKAILFSSSVGTDPGEYKLTVIDRDLAIAVPEGKTVSAEGTTVTVPCEITGPDAEDTTRASVLILDREYSAGNAYGADILLYDALGPGGTFDLPAGCDLSGWGTDYYVYLLAENLNDPYRTDYASLPVPLNPPGSEPAAGEIREVPEEDTAPAEAVKDESNTFLGTAGISDPVPGSAETVAWSGNYVYFGKYNGKPIRFRVLAKNATAYTAGKALFLDSDEVLFVDYFDKTEPYSNSWEDSDIRSVLNGPFLENFTAAEQTAIAQSTGDGGRPYGPDAPETPVFGAPVSISDRVFLPDVADVTNAAYGYPPGPGWKYIFLPGPGIPGHVKWGAFSYWWVRTAAADSVVDVGVMNCSGVLNTVGANYYMGVAPALNIDQEAILFATSVEGDPGAFKLTVIDRSLTVPIPESRTVSVSGTTVTVPYETEVSGSGDVTRVSVLILDKAYTTGNENGAGILLYRALDSGTFDLPEGCDPDGWGTDYHVYLLAENILGPCETDYAGVPVPVNPPPEVPE